MRTINSKARAVEKSAALYFWRENNGLLYEVNSYLKGDTYYEKAWKIGISTIAGIVGACVLIRIHNAEVRKVYCERYGKGYDEGYALGLYQGKLMGANDLYMNAHNGSEYFNNYMIEARKEFVETNTKLNK